MPAKELVLSSSASPLTVNRTENYSNGCCTRLKEHDLRKQINYSLARRDISGMPHTLNNGHYGPPIYL